ncbi:hypothetical protein ACWEIJ_10950 [Lentzea sp. NPDC004789]
MLFFLIALITGVGIEVAVPLLVITVLVVAGTSVTDLAIRRRR